ncbi:MAG: hypothetical protein JHD16_00875 [Solirubrobacteraceae bacterium]|nr:hypothetical protein [Solirubrobacteraceae bacterium]
MAHWNPENAPEIRPGVAPLNPSQTPRHLGAAAIRGAQQAQQAQQKALGAAAIRGAQR